MAFLQLAAGDAAPKVMSMREPHLQAVPQESMLHLDLIQPEAPTALRKRHLMHHTPRSSRQPLQHCSAYGLRDVRRSLAAEAAQGKPYGTWVSHWAKAGAAAAAALTAPQAPLPVWPARCVVWTAGDSRARAGDTHCKFFEITKVCGSEPVLWSGKSIGFSLFCSSVWSIEQEQQQQPVRLRYVRRELQVAAHNSKGCTYEM
jgi:hypothetical protein